MLNVFMLDVVMLNVMAPKACLPVTSRCSVKKVESVCLFVLTFQLLLAGESD
jgi:hypothetical protein